MNKQDVKKLRSDHKRKNDYEGGWKTGSTSPMAKGKKNDKDKPVSLFVPKTKPPRKRKVTAEELRKKRYNPIILPTIIVGSNKNAPITVDLTPLQKYQEACKIQAKIREQQEIYRKAKSTALSAAQKQAILYKKQGELLE